MLEYVIGALEKTGGVVESGGEEFKGAEYRSHFINKICNIRYCCQGYCCQGYCERPKELNLGARHSIGTNMSF